MSASLIILASSSSEAAGKGHLDLQQQPHHGHPRAPLVLVSLPLYVQFSFLDPCCWEPARGFLTRSVAFVNKHHQHQNALL